MPLSREQRRVASQIYGVGRRMGASRKEILAALETGIVESGLRNINYGDRDSVGWRQERSHYGSVPERMNVQAGARRFFQETRAAGPSRYRSAGQLAADVQRPAEQYRGRYDQVRGQALDVLGWLNRTGGAGQADTRMRGGRVVTTEPTTSREAVLPGGTGVAELTRAMLEQSRPQPVASSASIPTPGFLAGPAMPSGYQPVESGAPAPPRSSLGQLLEATRGLQTEGIPQTTVTPGSVDVVGGRPQPAGRERHRYGPSGGTEGKVVGRPLDRPGVRTKPYVVGAVRQIAGILGSPIQLGTGTAHSQMTTSGHVSNHWTGDAIDLPAAGKRLYAMGRSALIAAGMNPKQARRAPGGLYNLNGWQIIFATTDGGNHWDHVHVRPAPRRQG